MSTLDAGVLLVFPRFAMLSKMVCFVHHCFLLAAVSDLRLLINSSTLVIINPSSYLMRILDLISPTPFFRDVKDPPYSGLVNI